MSDLKYDILLQSEQADGSFVCTGFNGVPAARKSWICISSSGSSTGRAVVAALTSQIVDTFKSTSPEVSVEDVACPSTPATMDSERFPDRRKLLVLVAAPDRPLRDEQWYRQWHSDEHGAAVMTVLPSPAFDQHIDPSITSDDHLLRRVNAFAWSSDAAEVIPSILSRAEVTSDVARVFISYRRVDTLPIAMQIFDRLTHEGFEVFLDRFSIPPGYDFQRRLNQELEDKSMVLLLESKSVRDSRWTQHEVDFAKRYRLGLACIRVPDLDDCDILPSVSMRPRLTLTSNHFLSPPRGAEWQRLKPDAEELAVSFIKREHANSLFERRQRIRQDAAIALAGAGIEVESSSVGPIRATVAANQHLIWITTRPPDLSDFHDLHVAHRSRPGRRPGWRAAILGPQAALESQRRKRLNWLSARTKCVAFDEARLTDFANHVASWR